MVASARENHRLGRVASLSLLSIMVLWTTGCGMTGGQLLYLFGAGRGTLVKPEFEFKDKPVLILVDDAASRVNWPAVIRHLADDLREELRTNKAAKEVVPQNVLDRIRQNEARFEKRGCREIGELAGAELVLWLEIQDFLADEQIADPSVAAYITVTVKVINVQEKKRKSRVRAWPINPDGRSITAVLNGSDVTRLKTKDAISRELSAKLAGKIAKLFYEHRLGDFES